MEQQTNSFRKMLALAVSNVLLEAGVEMAEKDVLATLTEMIQCYITEIGYQSKNFCELAGRNEPIIADIIMSFVEMGIDFSGFQNYVKSQNHAVLPSLQPQQPPKQTNMLQAGTRQELPTYIPQHFPNFPDPHAYIRTPTHKQPVIDYEAIREKFAIQKKEMEKALTKFLARTNPINNLFDNDEANIFPLIACKPHFPPYLKALLPQDQVFDTEDLDYDPKAQIQNEPTRKRFKSESKLSSNSKGTSSEEKTENNDDSVKTEKESSHWEIDNPYLAATKLPVKNDKEC